MTGQLKILTTVGTHGEAEIVNALLLEAGIHSIAQRTIGGPLEDARAGRDIYVDEHDLERARGLLKAQENPISDEELTRLSEEAGREANES